MVSIKDKIAKQEREQLEKAIAYAGTPSTLARLLGVTPQAVYEWQKRGRISATAAALLETRTAGQFKKADMRPDVTNWYL